MTDLVSLLYRADWTRLSLAAEVSVRHDLDLDRTRLKADSPPPRPGTSGKWPRISWGRKRAGPRC
jgi:hypothetical protein